MKKAIKKGFLLGILAVTAFINPLKAQDATKELAAFTKQFQANYNKHDDKALKEMYTKDAVRTMSDGKINEGREAIGTYFADYFKNNTVTVELKQDKVTEKDGTTTTNGTYHVTGTSKTGEKIDRKGSYTNTVVKENGHWKIAKSVLVKL